MTIGIKGRRDAGVTHLIHDVFRAFPVFDQDRCKEMSKVMEPLDPALRRRFDQWQGNPF